MVKRGSKQKRKTADRNMDAKHTTGKKPTMSEKELRKIEDETLAKVNSAISSLEIAIAGWNASEKKPEDLVKKYRNYVWLHEELSRWATRMLKSRKNKTNFDERIGLLGEFVKICNSYESV